MKFFLLLCLAGAVQAIDDKQLHGLKKLLKNLDSGVFPTCRIVLFSELVDFNTAEKNCQNFDIGMGANQKGNLATVNDEDKNADLTLLLSMAYKEKGREGRWDDDQWVWAGMRKTKNNNGKRKNKVYNAADWQWADGSSPLDYHNWMKKQPDQATQTKDGVKYLQNQMRINHKGIWDDTFVFKTHPYACDYQGKYIVSANLMTWTQAKGACEDAGLQLAKIRSDAEVVEIQRSMDYFLGPQDDSLRTYDPMNWLWLGGTDEGEEGMWKWIDGTPIEYDLPWREPMPDNARMRGRSQNVLSVSRWGEFDDSFDHHTRKRPFACQCPGT